MSVWLIWLIAAAILLIIEVLTQMMWALCLTIGALGGMTASLCGAGPVAQCSVALVVSIAAYAILLPVFKRRVLHTNAPETRTGMDALLGRRAIVTHAIHPGRTGRARIDGDNWQVRAPGAQYDIPAGTQVVVTGYDSIILNVEVIS